MYIAATTGLANHGPRTVCPRVVFMICLDSFLF